MANDRQDNRGSSAGPNPVAVAESDQLDMIQMLREYQDTADGALQSVLDVLNPNIDANPTDKLLMEMFDVVTDAQESLHEFGDLLDTMERRDEAEVP